MIKLIKRAAGLLASHQKALPKPITTLIIDLVAEIASMDNRITTMHMKNAMQEIELKLLKGEKL